MDTQYYVTFGFDNEYSLEADGQISRITAIVTKTGDVVEDNEEDDFITVNAEQRQFMFSFMENAQAEAGIKALRQPADKIEDFCSNG